MPSLFHLPPWRKERRQPATWIGVDFDGTLVKQEYPRIGEPLEPMVERVKGWLAKNMKVKIFTARANNGSDISAIKKWSREHLGKELEVTNKKDHYMLAYYDDKAFHVEYNTGEVQDVEGVDDAMRFLR